MSDGIVRQTAVIGAGAWGTALADLLARNGHPVHLWAREPDVVEAVNAHHENARFLAGVQLDRNVRATGDMREAVSGARIVVYSPPAHVLRDVVRGAAESMSRDAVVAVAIKGIERETFALMTDVVEAELGDGHAGVVAISGPSFAAEVAARQPTAIVAAASAAAPAVMVQHALSSAEFRV